MRKCAAILLAALLALSCAAAAQAELILIDDTEFQGGPDEPQRSLRAISSEAFGEFVVGATTTLTGHFFTDMWGNNTCDIDVRSLLHGLETVYWALQPIDDINPSVITDADAVTLANGNRRYTLTFADDLYYNDGTKISAADYAFCFLIHSAPQVADIGGMTAHYAHIAGWDAYESGECDYFSGVRLPDSRTLSIEINADYLPYFYELGMIEAIPYPIGEIAPGCEVADDGDGVYIRNIDPAAPPVFTAETLARTILDPDTGYRSHPRITSGPWQMVSFDWETRTAQFSINEYFKGNWEGQRPVIDRILFRNVLPGEMADELESGGVHLINKAVAAEDIDALLAVPDTAIASYPRLGFGFLNFSCETGPCRSEAVRRAIGYAIDTDAFVQAYNQYYGQPVYGYYGIGQWMYMALQGMFDIESVTEEYAELMESLSLDQLNPYDMNLAEAARLLDGDGWTLNTDGEPYAGEPGEVRAKYAPDGELMPLMLRYGKMQDSIAAEILLSLMEEPLAELGFLLSYDEVPFADLLAHYYRQRERVYDIIYLATNFVNSFDPYFVFHTDEAYHGHTNTTGLQDEALMELALDLRRTPPGAYVDYMAKWVAFQTAFNAKLPLLPLYGNVYFDVFTDKLYNYQPDSERYDWPVALLYAELAERE
jgi:ABC-type transport system substrate-binding protein